MPAKSKASSPGTRRPCLRACRVARLHRRWAWRPDHWPESPRQGCRQAPTSPQYCEPVPAPGSLLPSTGGPSHRQPSSLRWSRRCVHRRGLLPFRRARPGLAHYRLIRPAPPHHQRELAAALAERTLRRQPRTLPSLSGAIASLWSSFPRLKPSSHRGWRAAYTVGRTDVNVASEAAAVAHSWNFLPNFLQISLLAGGRERVDNADGPVLYSEPN